MNLFWRESLWLLMALLPVLWLLLARWRAVRLRRCYADETLWPWALAQTRAAGTGWRRAALLSAWLLLAAAAAGPRLPAYLPPELDAAGADLMVVLDLSRSMAAEDVWPSRRRLAQRAVEQLLPQLAGSRVGLVIAAGRPHRLWPLSSDRQGLAALVAQLDRLRPPSHGSDLAGAVQLARQELLDATGERHLLLLTDGDLAATEWQALADAASTAQAGGTRVLVAGVGTRGGAALPGADGDWLSVDGEVVLSRLEAARLQDLAGSAGYLTLPERQPAAALRDALPDTLTRPRIGPDAALLWHELFPWLLLPAGVLWLAASVRLPRAAPIGLAGSLAYLVGLGLVLPAQADPLEDAYRTLQGGDAQRARELYAELPGYAGRMGSGSACHRLGDWQCARQAFAQAVLVAPDDPARAAAIYNLAHSVFQDGDFAGAAALFDDALRYRPDYPAARHNRDFATALAAEVKRLAGGPQSARPGRGAASRGGVEGPLPEDARLQLDDSDSPPPVAALSTAERQALLNRGLAYTRLAEARAVDAAAPWGRGDTGPDASRPDVSLWQTMIERAEGLPASPAQPLTRPGTRPW